MKFDEQAAMVTAVRRCPGMLGKEAARYVVSPEAGFVETTRFAINADSSL